MQTVYICGVMVWLFFSMLMLVAMPGLQYYPAAVIATLLALYIVHCSANALRGRKLLGWQRGIVALPWRMAGNGGRPIEAAKGSSEGRRTVVMSLVLTAIIAVATFIGAWLLSG